MIMSKRHLPVTLVQHYTVMEIISGVGTRGSGGATEPLLFSCLGKNIAIEI